MLEPGTRIRTTRELRQILPDAPVPDNRADMPWTGEVISEANAGGRDEERVWLVRFDDIPGEHAVPETVLMPMHAHPDNPGY